MTTDHPGPDAPDVGEADLHALVDGQLDPRRAAAVLHWLQQHPHEAVRVCEWQAQRLALRQLHRSLEIGPTPAALLQSLAPLARATPRPGRWRGWQGWPGWSSGGRWQMASAALLLLGVGLFAGRAWQFEGDTAAPPQALAGPGFVHDAAIAYAVYTPEQRHPVEVGADDEAHLVQWLTKRLGTPLKAPSLLAQGFRLLGGRLLPGDHGPRAQFMYEDGSGRRVTLYVTVFGPAQAPTEPAFRSVRDGKVESFYWIDHRLGYAFSAELSGGQALRLAQAAYQQLSP